MKVLRLAAICFIALRGATTLVAQDVTPGRVDSAEGVLIDARCDDREWGGAARTPLTETSALLVMHDETSVYLCATLPPESYGTMDLYVMGQGDAFPVNLHASAQVGERRKTADGWPEWTFGNHRSWYSPPVAVTGAQVVDGRARMTFSNVGGREVAIEKRKFGASPWRFMIEIRALGTEKRGSLRFPSTGNPDDASTWSTLRFDNVETWAVTTEAKVLDVFSPSLGETRSVWVSAPPECTNQKRCPVLYVLDAHALFPIATSYGAVMTRMGRLPPLVVVGLPSSSQAGRARDFIPTPGVTESERERVTDARGSARFGDFLGKELAPLIESRFPVSNERTLAGHSLAGLYAVHSLAKADTFDNLIALSPSLGWGAEATLRDLLDGLKAKKERPRRLYASVAGGDTPPYHVAFDRLSNSVARAKAGWLKHRFKRYSEEDHVTTVAPALQDALKWLYQKND
jgi:predicted alpha/beta superfamily hydrolase